MSDLIDRDFIKRLGGKCIARRDKETGELIAIIGIDLLPSAQPEIMRCKDCKHYEGGWYCSAWNNSPGFPIVTEEGYCNLAKRRTDDRE